MDSLDLGQTDLVKHHIELTDYAPIKDRYRRILPHQYEEVRKHLKEMLEIGANSALQQSVGESSGARS